jgi:hypothetical protein
MARITAKQLGQILGKTAREVNETLKESGFLEGELGNYTFTEKGAQYGEEKDEDNGYGGSAHRSWSYKKWDEEIVNEISNDRFPGVAWYCDNCNAYLRGQAGFGDHKRVWKCTDCGHPNRISASEIR